MKFFNSFRRKIFGSGFGKYLLYAIGEIILVVIGILLAISINDYYTKVKIKEKTEEVSEQILNQMIADDKKLTEYLDYLLDLRETIFYYNLPVKERRGKKKPLKNTTKLDLFFDRDKDLLIIGDMVATQIQNYDFTTVEYSQLLYNIQADYSYGIKTIEKQSDYILEKNNEFNKSLAKKHDWYQNWMANLNCANDCIEFIMNSEEFDKHLIAFQYDKVSLYGYKIELFQSKLKENIEKLRKVLNIIEKSVL